METGNKLTAARGRRGWGEWWKEGKGIRQRTYMNDPWIWTMVGGLTGSGVMGWAEEGKGGKIGTAVIE